MQINRRSIVRGGVAVAAALTFSGAALAQDATIKVGVLHSLSGTMAISETTLKDVMLMLIEEQNKKGGLLGKSSKRSSSILHRTGHCSLKKPAS
jgi:urea transport system substrate-binding protein